MYSDFHDRGINLAREIPRMGTPESDYTPRLLLVLVETLGEGSALLASQLGIPELRGWTTIHDLLINMNNTQLTDLVVQLRPEDRKGFEYVKSPMAKYFEEQNKKKTEKERKRGRAVLLEATGANGAPIFDELPEHLRG